MDADVLNAHVAKGTAAAWAVEGSLVSELESLLRKVGKEAAAKFESTVVRFGLQAAASPSSWAMPNKGEVLDMSALQASVEGVTGGARNAALAGFFGEMPTCVLPAAEAKPKWDTAWVKSLKADERSAVISYRATGYKNINALTRGFKIPAAKIETTADQVAALDRAIGKSVAPKDITVYRGIKDLVATTADMKGEFIEDTVGQKFRNMGYSSATYNKRIAAKFAGKGRDAAVFKIDVPKGTHIAQVDKVSRNAKLVVTREQEYLLPRGTTFEVTGVTQERLGWAHEGETTVIHVKVVNDGYNKKPGRSTRGRGRAIRGSAWGTFARGGTRSANGRRSGSASMGSDSGRGATSALVAAAGCDGVTLKWDVTSRLYGQTLASTGEHITAISENVRADVMGVIEKAYTEGASVSETGKMIEDVMSGSAQGWAETIARTELNRLANGASLDAVSLVGEAAGVTYLKEWLTAPGAAHPRHELDEGLDGQTVELDAFFDVGGTQLEYPGDPNGDPGETINCRCTLIYHDSGGGQSVAANSEADLAGGAAVTSTSVATRTLTASALRKAVREQLTAAGISPTYPMTHGNLAELRFYEAVEEAGYDVLDSAWWPTEKSTLSKAFATFLDGDSCAVYKFSGGQIAHVCLGLSSISVKVAGESPDAASAVLDTFRATYPASFVRTEGDSRVPITFWSMGSFGPQPRLRRIESASWEGIERNYTADVREQLASLMAWTEPGDDGQLILWQGAPGTGKTWALRALASEWSNWAEFNYITDPDSFFVDNPSYMVDVLLSESYAVIDSDGEVFEETAAEGKWRVLILEDTGELLSATAKEKYGQGLSRLLNVVDGMIGQGLRVFVLVTTNDELGELNPAVKRPGRCASQIVFTPLDPSEAAAWLGSDVEEGLTVAELYERTKNGEEALAIDDSMPCANCEHTYADHSGGGACSMEGCSCGSFDDGDDPGDQAAELEPVAASSLEVPGITSLTLNGQRYDLATAPVTEADPAIVEAPEQAVTDASMARWNAAFAPEGKMTDDGRIFAPNSITWRELPLSLMALVETGEGGHQGAQIVGRIDRIWRDEASTPTMIRAEGVFDSSEFGQEVARLVGNKILRGNSVDLAVREYIVGNRADYVDEEGNWLGNDVEQVESDLLDVLFGGEDLVMVVTDGVIGMSTVCPFPAFEDGEISLAASGVRFFVVADPTNLRWNVRTEEAFSLCDELTASAAGLVPVTPPREWFDMPEPDELTPLTIDEEGRVYGHAWTWNECHIGIPNKCTVAPHTQTDYAHFLLKEVEVALDEEGDVTERIACGTITLGTGHAQRGLGAEAAAEHYDNTGAAVADVVIVDGEHGGWICGALRPDTPAAKVRELRGAVLSGDWRGIGGNLELVGLLAVNVPGFPVPRTKALVAASVDGEESDVVTLIAAGPVIAVDNPHLDEATRSKLRALAARAEGGFEGLAKLASSSS